MTMLLNVDKIDVLYDHTHVLHDVSLTVAESEVVALIGRNGAGKTTTLRGIIGIQPPRSGTVNFKGQTVSGLKTHEIARRGISYVPESRDVFSYLTVEENLLLGQNPAAKWSIDDILRWFPALQPILNRRGLELSGGQQQMVAIGRSLLPGPELLLLDEPSQGLAPVIVNSVIAMLRDLKKEGLSVLIVEQNVRAAIDLADRVYVLENGHIVFHARADEIADDLSQVEKYLGVRTA
jgi:branched-chain amino acid transport system ATP-binding protein